MKLRPIANPPNPYLSIHAEWLEPPPLARLEIYEDHTRSILSRNDSPDLPFTWSVNPYRGCQHACSYCYARPYHEYLGYGAGTDFDTRLVAKPEAPALLRRAFAHPKWRGEMVNFSGVTDCYQPIEAVYMLTRRCLEVCLEFRNPVSVVTKGFLVVRDADLLAQLHGVAAAAVYVSLPIFDRETAAVIEPQAPPPARRIEAIRRLREAGVPTGVMIAPVIPGLSDRDIPAILEAAVEAGAQYAGFIPLRLPGSVEQVFVERLHQQLPLKAERILARLREVRGGRYNDSRFGKRMKGQGAYWESVRALFSLHATRLGLRSPRVASPLHREATKAESRENVPQPPRSSQRAGWAADPAQSLFDF